MENDLEKLMRHIDYFFEPVKSTYNPEQSFEIYLKEGRWIITDLLSGEVFGTTEYEEALNHLVENKADLLLFHTLLHSKICTEGVLRRKQLKKCEELVGVDSIDESEKVWEGFAEKLLEIINTEKEKPTLELV